MSQKIIEHNNQTYVVSAEMIKGQLWIHLDGESFVYEAAQGKSFAGKNSKKISSGKIAAPMPGKVTKFLKNKGDSVVVGDALLVMEAMKMEYTLKADKDGIIGSIHCAPGDLVSLGKTLVEIV